MAMIAALLQCVVPVQSLSQPPLQPGTLSPPGTTGAAAPLRTVKEHWNLFIDETLSPISAIGTIFNAGFSQLTHSDPQYGADATAFGQRIGGVTMHLSARPLPPIPTGSEMGLVNTSFAGSVGGPRS
jgi:hypothetical protein